MHHIYESERPRLVPENVSRTLIGALCDAGAPPHLIVNARLGIYHARFSPFTFPKIALLCHLRDEGLHDLAHRVMNGEFD